MHSYFRFSSTITDNATYSTAISIRKSVIPVTFRTHACMEIIFITHPINYTIRIQVCHQNKRLNWTIKSVSSALGTNRSTHESYSSKIFIYIHTYLIIYFNLIKTLSVNLISIHSRNTSDVTHNAKTNASHTMSSYAKSIHLKL